MNAAFSFVSSTALLSLFLSWPLSADEPLSLNTLYQTLHAAPELSFEEAETAARLAGELSAVGFEVTTGIGGHGLVGVLANGQGPTVLVRTDLDALPVTEDTGLAFASRVQTKNEAGQTVGVMHACGHDVHMTVFVGTARALASDRDSWSGTLVMIGQPAEERGAGARAMLDDGLFQRFPRPDYNLALHVSAELAAGTVGIRSGAVAANVDSVDIAVLGQGGHGAYPHKTHDPVLLAASIVMNLQTLVSRTLNPIDPGVVTVGSIHGGTKHNIIPDQVDLQLTVRSFSDESRQTLLQGIEQIAVGQARALGWPDERLPRVVLKEEYTPSVWNDPALAERLQALFAARLGAEKVFSLPPTMGGEDFARYGRDEPRIPSSLFWLGAVDPVAHAAAAAGGPRLPSLHSSKFKPDAGAAVETGVSAMTSAVRMLLPAAD